MRFLLRVLVSAAALGVATAAVPGIELLAGSGWSRVGTLLAVALIFGLINATLKPVIKVIGCAFYVLTLGLAALVVNGLLLWLTSVSSTSTVRLLRSGRSNLGRTSTSTVKVSSLP